MAASVEVEVDSALHAAREARRKLEEAREAERVAVVRFVDKARHAHWLWPRIGAALGQTDVAVRRYYARNRPKMRGMGSTGG